MSRGPRGGGSIFKLDSGKWQAQLTVWTQDSDDSSPPKRRYLTRTRRTQREAFEALRELREEVEHAAELAADPGRIPMSVFLDEWMVELEAGRADNKIRAPKTVEFYRWGSKKARTYFGDRPVSEVTPDAVNRLLHPSTNHRLGASSRQKVRVCLKLAFDYAVAKGLIAVNPVVLSDGVSQKKDSGRRSLTADQAATLVEALQPYVGEGGLELVWLTALCLGLRRGEVLGLRWSSIDITSGLVRINEQALDASGDLVPLKTESSRRLIGMPEELRVALKVHRKAEMERRMALGAGKSPSDLVFTNAGEPWQPSKVSRDFVAFATKTGLRHPVRDHWTMHELRHSYATLLLSADTPLTDIKDLLGHSSVSTTQRYVHLLEKARMEAANNIGSVLWNHESAG